MTKVKRSRMARFEEAAKARTCPRCRKARLIPRLPNNYKKLRCLNCGTLFTIKEK